MSAMGGEFNRSLQHCSPELSGVALEQFLRRTRDFTTRRAVAGHRSGIFTWP